VHGDESWFYHRKIKSKQEPKVWVEKRESILTEVRRQQFEEKTMFVIFYDKWIPTYSSDTFWNINQCQILSW
jgi:hypothetical protein